MCVGRGGVGGAREEEEDKEQRWLDSISLLGPDAYYPALSPPYLHVLMPVTANTRKAFYAPRQTLTKKVELLLQKLAFPVLHFRASVDPQI